MLPIRSLLGSLLGFLVIHCISLQSYQSATQQDGHSLTSGKHGMMQTRAFIVGLIHGHRPDENHSKGYAVVSLLLLRPQIERVRSVIIDNLP